mmetsp:Transcript_3696/g.14478  ORF Transcript_3696/g.14478 Transcript_3696/m.14478 type:complete len:191 (-) Transcript_3696:503-1075(-)
MRAFVTSMCAAWGLVALRSASGLRIDAGFSRRAFLHVAAPAVAAPVLPVVAATGEELKGLLESTKVEMQDDELAKIRSAKPEGAAPKKAPKAPKTAAAPAGGGGGVSLPALDLGDIRQKAAEEGRARAEARRAQFQKAPAPAKPAGDADDDSADVYASLRAKREKQKADAEEKIAKKKKNRTAIEEFKAR